jgi:nucleotide-binding universal stress UspA family protein
MFEHLLVPLDGSEHAEKALPAAMELSRRFGSKLTLVRVVAPAKGMLSLHRGYAASFTHIVELARMLRQEAEDYLKHQQDSLQEQGFVVDLCFVEDVHVANAILYAAAEMGADTIVISTHGRDSTGAWLLGSVCSRVLQHAPVPVLLIRSIPPEG